MENTFGIFVVRWRLFQKPIDAKPERVEKTIVAAIAFYNYLRQTDSACYTPNGFVNSEDNSGTLYLDNGGVYVHVNVALRNCNIFMR